MLLLSTSSIFFDQVTRSLFSINNIFILFSNLFISNAQEKCKTDYICRDSPYCGDDMTCFCSEGICKYGPGPNVSNISNMPKLKVLNCVSNPIVKVKYFSNLKTLMSSTAKVSSQYQISNISKVKADYLINFIPYE